MTIELVVNDIKNREKALDISKSFIIQAPAGSGKTELLTQRYLKLLGISKNPESVLALTFTKKAVAELKSRVINALKIQTEPQEKHKKLTYKLAQKALLNAKKYHWNILENHNRINILTIDALASQINNNYPQGYNFSIKNTLDSALSADFYTQAAKQTLIQIADETSVYHLLKHLDNRSEDFISLVAEMLKVRDKWINKLFNNNQVSLASINKCVNSINYDHLQELEKNAKTNLTNEFFNLCSFNTDLDFLNKIPADINIWSLLKDKLFTKNNTLRKNITGFVKENKLEKKRFIQIINNFSTNFKELIINIQSLPEINIDEKLLVHIIKVLFIAKSNLAELFNQHSQTDFIEIMLNANNALDTNNKISDISLTLDYKLEHILIDEFQDTSYQQLELIEKIITNWELESGRTLFLVGDPMQSIYYFRGAQVGVFLQTKKSGIAHIKLHNLVLSQNFRSSAKVITTNNSIFTQIFPEKNNINQGAISYAPSATNDKNIADNALTIYPFGEHQEQQEALQMLEIIQKNIDKEIAILCLARTHTSQIIKLLTTNNIPFEAIKNTKLVDNIFVKDLLNIVKILLNQEDRLSWFSLLRSPWCGLQLDDILKLNSSAIYPNLENNKNLSTNGQHRAQQIFIIFKNALDNFGSFNFENIIIKIVKDLNIINTINNNEQIILDKFIQIIYQCRVNNQLNINHITNYLKDLYAPSKNCNIKIMTIHEAKGLEFEIVILPSIGKGGKIDKKELINISEFKNHGILIAPKPNKQLNRTYEYLRYIDKKRQEFEKIRLLYVAMTRAKSQIHILGNVGKKGLPVSGSFLKLLWSKYSTLWSDVTHNKITTELKTHNWWRYQNIPNTNIINIIRAEQGFDITNIDLNASIIGIIIHKFLQLEIFFPSELLIKNQLFNYGISQVLIKDNIKIVQNHLINTKNSEDFNFIFKTRKMTLTEAEFSKNGKSIIIDRVFIENNILWIIDFKTAITANVNITDQQQQTYSKQLQNYKTILQDIYSYKIKTAIFLTSIGRMITL